MKVRARNDGEVRARNGMKVWARYDGEVRPRNGMKVRAWNRGTAWKKALGMAWKKARERAWGYCAVTPPSMTSSEPVTNADSSDAR